MWLQKHRGWAEKHEGSTFRELETQFDMFVVEMQTDKKLASWGQLDLSDVDAVWSFLKEQSREAGYATELLTVLQRLLQVPQDKQLG